MSETQDRKEFLDRFYPFLEPGQEPPGHWAPNEQLGGRLAWQGRMGWRTRHGDAVSIWDPGEPRQVENAHYPDGTRGEARKTLDHGFRRRSTNSGHDRLWIYGRIDIRPDDILFIDGEQPVYQPPPLSDVPNLEADLARDPAFLVAIKDDRFALAVLNVFDNRTFYKGQDPRSWMCGSRMAARLVANLRDKGESYQDYFPGHAALPGTYPDDRPDTERSLQKRIDQISKSLETEPPLGFPVEDLAAWLGPGEHPPEEVRRVMQLMQKRPEFEKRRAAESEAYRTGLRAALEKAEHDLAALREDHTNEDIFDALRANLGRLGWRTETEQDRARLQQEWLVRALKVLEEVKDLEQRPPAPTPAWAEPLRSRQSYGRGFEPGELEAMSPDVRMVETEGLNLRLKNLALTGRITEQEYRALNTRLSRVTNNSSGPTVVLGAPDSASSTGRQVGDDMQSNVASPNPRDVQ